MTITLLFCALQGSYMTIHITPEPEFSYVSFESNIPEAAYEEVIMRVLRTFKPGKFVVSIFANKESIAADCPRDLEQNERLGFEGDFVRNDVQYCRFKNYDLTCAFYSKFPSWGFMDASSSVSACCSDAPDEATNIFSPFPLPISSSSLPPSHYLQTCPHLLNNNSMSNSNNNHSIIVNSNETQQQHHTMNNCVSSHSLNFDSAMDNSDQLRRQSLKSDAQRKTLEQSSHHGEVDLTNSSRSTSSPQLMSVKPRSKVYRRASLKSLTNLNTIVSPAHSRIIKVSSRNKSEKRLASDSQSTINSDAEDKENVCNPLSHPYPYSTPCQKKSDVGQLSKEPSPVKEEPEQEQQEQQPEEKQKGKSCSSFLPILSLIPHTMISFQYPSPKMKFSWWRNKISWRHA